MISVLALIIGYDFQKIRERLCAGRGYRHGELRELTRVLEVDMAGFLTTHVLDTARGVPAGGLKIELFRLDGEVRTLLANVATNDDGRTDNPILPRRIWMGLM